MNKKIVGIFIMALFIATAVLPAVGTMNFNMKDEALISGPEIEWTKTYGCDEFDLFRCVKQTSDGGYIAFGEYEENNKNYARLIKLDSKGEEVWSVINPDINGTGFDVDELMNYVIQTSDGGYLASGYENYYFIEGDIWLPCGFLWKVDSDGDTEWLKYYYDSDELLEICIFQLTEVEDGYIGGGIIVDFVGVGSPDYDFNFSIMKVDFDGNLVWYKTYDLGGYEYSCSFDITSDGGYFLSGTCSSDEIIGNDDDVICMMKADSNGVKEWHQIYDGSDIDFSNARGCCQTNDGGYMMVGTTESYHAFGGDKWDIWQIKTDSTGNKEWENLFGGEGYDMCWSMQMTSDGGYILLIDYNQGSDDVWLVKTDEDGKVIWSFIIVEEDSQVPMFIDETDDGGFIIGGRTGNPDAKTCDSFLLKVGSFDNERPLKPTIDGPSKGKIGKSYVFSASSSDPEGGNLLYFWDWGDGNYTAWFTMNEKAKSYSTEDNFEIRVKVKDEAGGESEWSDPFMFSTPRDKQIFSYLNLFDYLLQLITYLHLRI